MSTELSNLLPGSNKRAFRRQYFARLGTVALITSAVLIVLHGLMLLPTYLYARAETARVHEQLELARAAVQSSEEQEVAQRTNALTTTAQSLARLESTAAGSAALRAVLFVPRPGVALTGFTFTAPTAANNTARLQVSGIADSRDALRSYASALGQLPFVSTADLPISAYANERDIEFTITLSGTLRP